MLACQRITADPTITLTAAARGSGMGYERFRKVFREHTGVTPGVFRILRRLDRARALLHEGERSIAAIAEELGYASPFAFSSQFKRFVGVAPNHYRQAR
jgi:AraC-like DNA-binding protein